MAKVVFTIEAEIEPDGAKWKWTPGNMHITTQAVNFHNSLGEIERKAERLFMAAHSIFGQKPTSRGRPNKYITLPYILQMAEGKSETEIISRVAKAFSITRAAARQALYRYRQEQAEKASA